MNLIRDPEALFRGWGVEVRRAGEHHHVNAGWLGVDCPFCSPNSGRFRLGYSLSGGFWNCWSCGPVRGGEAVKELSSLPWDAVRQVVEGLKSSRAAPPGERPAGRLVRPPGVGPLLAAHRRYLERKRRLDPDGLARAWGVAGIGHEGGRRYSWSLYIPVFFRGEEVSWTTRSLKDRGRRYSSAPADKERLPHKRLLFGEDFARHAVAVVEGPLDACAIGPGAVATFGTALSPAQVRRIAAYPTRVIAFDAEPGARRVARDLARDLSVFPGRTVIASWETGKDAAAADPAEIAELRRRWLDSPF